MKLSVYSLKKVLFDGDAESVNCQTTSGEITILNNHRPLISGLKKGTIEIIDKEKKEHYIPVSAGFLEVSSGSRIKLIVEA
ncbi:MAG: F0F1 ATP synthase subunit epsilon [Candidatus Liptonbacteria bacterium]|nr:F0F1 ATP synthase subunit epsilon [Candidatus Liptonbacteria bacterium]